MTRWVSARYWWC